MPEEDYSSHQDLEEFIIQLKAEGVKMIYIDPKKLQTTKTRLQTIHSSLDSDYIVIEDNEQDTAQLVAATKARTKDAKIGKRFKVLSTQDIDRLVSEAESGLDFVIVDVEDWKIIPLENIIAKVAKTHTKVFTVATTPVEVRKMFSILDVGVDGVIFTTSSIDQVREAMLYMGTKNFMLKPAKITEIKEVGDGERVCIDTTSMLGTGEGILVGSRSNFMFLVHNESVASSFTSPRPFRVNAGAVHSYTLAPDGTTKYLSEIETGVEVLIIAHDGKARRASVGRAKIERRPMLMVKATVDDEIGGIIAQDAETERFVKPNGEPISVTHLKKGDTILVYAKTATGRHFGTEVTDEYILEQ